MSEHPIEGLMLTAIMSAIMSTVAALMLLIATIVSIDFYKRWLRPDASDKKVVFVSRASIVCVGVIGVIIAILNPPGIFKLIVDTFSFLGAAFMPSYICAIWWKKANATGSAVSMVVGCLMAWSWGTFNLEGITGIHAFIAGVVPAWICMIIFSNFGKPTSPEMCDLIERAKGKKIDVSKQVEVAASKQLSTESKAITQFVFSRKSAMVEA